MKSKIIFIFLFYSFISFSQTYTVSITKSDPQGCNDSGSASINISQPGQSGYHVAGGGGGWYGNGAAGGGIAGVSISSIVTGGTQTAGGVATSPATNGAAYSGGDGYHQGGGGGSGCFGGAGGRWVEGGAGGSSCVSLLTNGSTVAGDGTQPGASINSVASSPSTSTSPSGFHLTHSKALITTSDLQRYCGKLNRNNS